MTERKTTETLVPPGAPNWITQELMEETLRVWGPKYEKLGETITPEDAFEMIMNVSELADILEIREHDGELYSPDPTTGKLRQLILGRGERG